MKRMNAALNVYESMLVYHVADKAGKANVTWMEANRSVMNVAAEILVLRSKHA